MTTSVRGRWAGRPPPGGRSRRPWRCGGTSRWSRRACRSPGRGSVCYDRGGRKPDDLPAPLRQAFARVAIAVVLPLPAGAKATCTRAPLVARALTELGLTCVEYHSCAAVPTDGEVDEELRDDVPVQSVPRPRGGVARRRGSRPRCTSGSRGRCRPMRRPGGGGTPARRGRGRHPQVGTILASPARRRPRPFRRGRRRGCRRTWPGGGLGPDVPHLPGRPGRLQDVDHTPRDSSPVSSSPFKGLSRSRPSTVAIMLVTVVGRHRRRRRRHPPGRATARAARAGCAARACRGASRGWPAGPGRGTRSGSAPGRGRPGTTQRADAAGVMSPRREDHSWRSRASMPSISRTGGVPGEGRSVNRTPSRSVSSASSRVL